jgi:hypothetical protein
MVNGTRKLSVVVSPRLQGASTLEPFGDFLNWYEKQLTFTLRFQPLAAGDGVTASVPAPPVPDERKPLWTALFDTDTTVKSYGFSDYSKLKINSYPIADILSYLQGTYVPIASDPELATQLPPAEAFLGDSDGLQHIAFGYFVGRTTSSELQRDAKRAKDFGLPEHPTDRLTMNFWALKDFLRPRNPLKLVTKPETGLSTEEYAKVFPLTLPTPAPDFHQAVALLGNHPELMRILGLVIDLEVAASEFDGGDPPAEGLVSVDQVVSTPGWMEGTVHAKPKTRFTGGFVAAPETQALSGRLLDLSRPEFRLVEVDVEGAAMKLMGLADTLVRSKAGKTTADTPAAFSLPSLRSGGISIVDSKHVDTLSDGLAKATSINVAVETIDQSTNEPQQPELAAEVLVRGYRIDVADVDDPTGSWRSLCGRRGHYAFNQGQLRWPPEGVQLDAEGFASLAMTAPPDGSSPEAPDVASLPSPELFVTQSLVRWNGWSLTARRPGDHIGTDDNPESFDQTQAGTEFGIAIEFGPPTGDQFKLPRLRFGHTYRLRARAVDLAGNSLAVSDDGATAAASDELKYTRFEPVVPPTLLLRRPVVDGESLTHVVIRSNNTDTNLDSVATVDTCDRHVAPPLASQLLAEAHGMFDAMAPGDSYSLVSSREGTYANPADVHDAEFPHTEASLALPYLPDPLSAGAAFLGLPGIGADAFLGLPGAPPNKETRYLADGSVKVTDLSASEKPPITLVEVDFDAGSWPDAKPFRLHVVEEAPAGPPSFDPAARELKVVLPKAEIARVRLSCYIAPEALGLLGIWKWLEDQTPALSAKQKQRLEQLALQGRHRLLTPPREVVLVHAVQQPIGTLDLSGLAVTREFGSTVAMLHDNLAVHAKSTGKIDVNAKWTETVDPPKPTPDPLKPDELPRPGPRQLGGSAHAFDVHVPYPGLPEKPSDNAVVLNNPHEFHDTKHRWVTYTAVATTRFREYFTSDIAKGGFEITRSSAPTAKLNIPSSARPEAPRVLYVVPMFEWHRPTPTKDGATSTRRGGGLRVYLERPWYSSGDDELLGVVLPDPAAEQALSPDDDSLKPYLTRWGADPIWASAIARPQLELTDLPLRTATSRGGLTLEEVDGYLVAVAGHEVMFDQDRQLWFSDIVVDPASSYAPFIRLALARYQPFSVEVGGRRGQPVKNVHLSRVVLADFAQLLPTRTATVSLGSPIGVSLAGVGLLFDNIEIKIQAQRPDLPTDLGWGDLAGTQVQPITPEKPTPGALRWTVTPPPGRPTTPRRLVIREREHFPTDLEGKVQGSRLVYAETFDL